MKAVRSIIGGILLALDKIFSPRSQVQRTPEQQKLVDEQCRSLKLYQFEACPFCIKVRREIKRLGLNIETRDVNQSKQWESELLAGGGEYQVPCLRIEENGKVRWMYESDDINAYLTKRFA